MCRSEIQETEETRCIARASHAGRIGSGDAGYVPTSFASLYQPALADRNRNWAAFGIKKQEKAYEHEQRREQQ
jgi:hypothetical protein